MREIQIKATRYHYTLTKIQQLKRQTNPSTGEDRERPALSYLADSGWTVYSHFGKQFGSIL